MEDIIKRGIYNKIVEVDPNETYFIAYYSDKVIKGTGLNITGWDVLPHGIVKLQYRLSTGRIFNIPRYKSYQILVEASMSIDRSGGLHSKNYHYIFVCGLADNCVYVHKIALRDDSNLGQSIGAVKIYTEKIPDVLSNSWKRSIY
jgi:hypothetical protein